MTAAAQDCYDGMNDESLPTEDWLRLYGALSKEETMQLARATNTEARMREAGLCERPS